MTDDALTHTAADGSARMVDIGAKPSVGREAVATGMVCLRPETVALVRQNGLKKGDVLSVARIAGIQAAKETSRLIPLCHQLALAHVGVEFSVEDHGVRITCTAKTNGPTGVEMEALAAVSVAALTVYDMCKAVDKTMRITDITLVSKTKSDPLP